MSTLGGFASNMSSRARRLPERLTQVKHRVARSVVTAVVTKTPIDTGRARYNWNVSLGKASDAVNLDPGFNSYSMTREWMSKLASSYATIVRATADEDVYIVNALPYIENLNRGSSPQAPADYVRTAVIAGALAVKGVKIL